MWTSLSVDLQARHRQSLVNEKPLVIHQRKGLEVQYHLRNDAHMGGLSSWVSVDPVHGRLWDIRQDLNNRNTKRWKISLTAAHLVQKRKTTLAWPHIAHFRVLHLAGLLHLLLDLGRHHSLPCSGFRVGVPLCFVMLNQVVGDGTGCWKKALW